MKLLLSLFSRVTVCAVISIAVIAVSCNSNETKTTETDSTAMRDSMKKSHDQMALPDTSVVAMVPHAEALLAGTKPDTMVSGTVKFDGDANTGIVKMVLEISVPTKANKSVAVHIHEHGDCGDMGEMAHGHWNPTNEQHGKWGSANFHSGDIGNIKLDAKGNGKMELETDRWTLGGMPVKNILRKSIIVHGGIDDYTSQPSGNAGSRIGCGVIQ
jgi:superoxide dismutase, Cu-Zn family